MEELYPLKFKPLFFEKIWGGKEISNIYPEAGNDLKNCGEAWLLSGIEGKESVVCNGYLEGNNINELVEVYMEDLVGEKNFLKYGNEFPILVKLINSSDWLSVQVHPDDNIAKTKLKLPGGKTEMWYAMNASKNAKLISGFNKKTDRNNISNSLTNNALKNELREIEVSKGDSFFIPAGLVHAIGPELLIAEIQQTCDITYRLWDWNRQDADGNKRELHIEEALQALNYSDEGGKIDYKSESNKVSELVSCPQFTTSLINIKKGMKIEKDIFHIDSFILYLCVEGSANITCNEITETINQGECILIPAAINEIELHPQNSAIILETTII